MSREIKFRLWIGKSFHYWGFILNKYGDYEFCGIPDTNMESLSMQRKMERSQQFTGLKDKDGKEICEGDILRELDETGTNFKNYPVIWSNGFWIRVGTMLEMPNEDRREVVGNIYENPELLGVKDE